jgi:phage terminase large subunit-like protein
VPRAAAPPRKRKIRAASLGQGWAKRIPLKDIPKWEKLLRLVPGYDAIATCEDAWFDPEIAERMLDFFPECLHHIEGELYGEPFKLEAWQQAVVANIFGWQRLDTRGRQVRRYREVLLYVARKNGKSPLCAGICLLVLFADRERGQQNYIAAGEREQAGNLFRYAKGMVDLDEDLSARCRIYGGNAAAGQAKSIVIEDEFSFLRVISADSETKHGGTTHLAIIDELHVQASRNLVDVLRTSTASANRPEPLTIYITTADFDRVSICNEVYDEATKVRDGRIKRASFLPVIYEAPKLRDGQELDYTLPQVYQDRKIWALANPNLGVSVSLDYLQIESERAKETPAYLPTFLRLHLNVRTRQASLWLDMTA